MEPSSISWFLIQFLIAPSFQLRNKCFVILKYYYQSYKQSKGISGSVMTPYVFISLLFSCRKP